MRARLRVFIEDEKYWFRTILVQDKKNNVGPKNTTFSFYIIESKPLFVKTSLT